MIRRWQVSLVVTLVMLVAAAAAAQSTALQTISPCRQFDSRVGGGPLQSGVPRTIVVTGPPCGVPPTATAISANVAIFNVTAAPSGNAVLTVAPAGSPATMALINWTIPAMGQVDNSGILMIGSGGSITFQTNQGGGTADMVIDIVSYLDGPVVRGVNPGAALSVTTTNENAVVGIAPGGVTSTELASNAVTLGEIAAGAVDTAAMADQAVTTAKLSPAGSTSGQFLSMTGWKSGLYGFKSTVVVSPVGTPAQNGAALIAAINGIPPATGNGYVVLIEPGTYDVESTHLPVRAGVDLKGWQRDQTVITSSSLPDYVASFTASVRFSDLTVACSGCTETISYYPGSPTLERVNVRNSACTNCYGIAGGGPNVGITLRDSSVEANGSATVTGVSGCRHPFIYDSEIHAVSSGGTAIGLSICSGLGGTSTDIKRSVITASGGTTNYGVNGESARLDHCDITGSTSTINNAGSIYVGYVLQSTLRGGPVSGPTSMGPTVLCYANLDENLAFYPNTCPP